MSEVKTAEEIAQDYTAMGHSVEEMLNIQNLWLLKTIGLLKT